MALNESFSNLINFVIWRFIFLLFVFPQVIIFLLYTTCVNLKTSEVGLCNVSIFLCRKKKLSERTQNLEERQE